MLGMMALGTLGSVAGSLLNSYSAHQTNKTNMAIADNATAHNAAEAGANRQFQADMSNTAYQRSMADMRKAGLNPMLAAGNGGASTPGGAQGAAAMAQVQSERQGDALMQGVSSAMEARRLKKELDATDSQISLNNQAKATASAQEALNATNAYKADNEARLTSTLQKMREAELPAVREASKLEAERSRIDQKMLKYDSTIHRINNALGAANSAVSIIKPFGSAKSIGDSTPSSKKWGKVNKRTGEIHD